MCRGAKKKKERKRKTDGAGGGGRVAVLRVDDRET